ncbi:MAG: FAD-dependent oxidoreductase [Burkholderiales bacterium RIFCSPLOWO2_02_FULL_57_36]|nr:MAG: FAD-dependent oxidoreductase [Burkholderiales bacterium RIFCSPLOWO2_02_FULL_57_36]
MQLSFWEHDAMLDADLIVIGGGIIGLQTALELRERRPQDRIVLLERGLLPSGASSRNAGFACFGSLTEILSDLDALGDAAVLTMVERRWRGLSRLRQRLGDDEIGYETFGGFDLLFDSHLEALQRLDEVNRKLQPLFGRAVFSVDTGTLAASGFGPRVKALVKNPLEGQVHSGKLMRALAKLAAARGIEIHTGAQVDALEENGGEVRVRVKGERNAVFRAPRVAVCTNGITGELLCDTGIVPARGQILVTEPIAGLPWQGTYHLDQGFYYFRNVGERVLLGGGRHLALDAEATTDMALSDTIQGALERLLHDTILPGREVRIEHRWSGVMGFAADKQPIVRMLSGRVALGFGCNGMGVALGAEIAAQTAELLLA